MSRTSATPVWTEAERELAKRIVLAVASADGALVGTLSVVRATCGVSATQKPSLRRKVQYVMPLAVEMAEAMYPGKALLVHADGTYQITDEATKKNRRVPLNRLKKAVTVLRRARAEVIPTGLEGIALRALLQTSLAALDDDALGRLIELAEESERVDRGTHD